MKTVQDLIAHAEQHRQQDPAAVRIVQQDGSAQESNGTVAQLLELLRRIPGDTAISPPRLVGYTCSYSLDPSRLAEFGQPSFSIEKPPFWDERETMYHVPNGPVPPASIEVTLPR